LADRFEAMQRRLESGGRKAQLRRTNNDDPWETLKP
jgi:hypothetical protein